MPKIIEITTGQNGYSAQQVADRAMTIAEMIANLQEMAENYGEDAVVVVRGYGNGAVYEPVRDVLGEDDEDGDEY